MLIFSNITILLLFIISTFALFVNSQSNIKAFFYYFFCVLLVILSYYGNISVLITEIVLGGIVVPATLLLGIAYSDDVKKWQKILVLPLYVILLILFFLNKISSDYSKLLLFLFIISSIRLIIKGIFISLSSIPYIGNKVYLCEKSYNSVIKRIFNDYFGISAILISLVIYVALFFSVKFNFLGLKYTSIMSKVDFSDGLFLALKNITPILSLYGMYFAFLQFVANGADRDMYMGENKLNYILNRSFSYQLSKSNCFSFFILSFGIIPFLTIFFARNKLFINLQEDMRIIWQLDFLFLIVLYVFLVITMIKTVGTSIELKIGKARWIEKQIENDIENTYDSLFIECLRAGEADRLFIGVRKQYNKMNNDSEKSLLIKTIFERIQKELRSRILEKKWSEVKIKKLFKFYKSYCEKLIQFLDESCDSISNEVWLSVLDGHLKLLIQMIRKDFTSIIYKQELSIEKEFIGFRLDLYVPLHGLLISQILKKDEVVIRVFSDFVKHHRMSFGNYFENKQPELNCQYIYRIREYQWEAIVKRLKDIDEDTVDIEKIFRYVTEDFKEFHSKTYFNILKNDRTYASSRNKNIQSLIWSMNEKYQLAYMLYQLLSTYDNQWYENIDLYFYCKNIKKIISNNNNDSNKVYGESKKILLETNIKYKFTDRFLDILWKTRNDIIKDWSWFKQFEYNNQSNFKVFFIQWMLGDRYSYQGRFKLNKKMPFRFVSHNNVCKNSDFFTENVNSKSQYAQSLILKRQLQIKANQRREEFSIFCSEYFSLRSHFSSDFENDCLSKVYNNDQLENSIDYLLFNSNLKLSSILNRLSINGLLLLEFDLRWNAFKFSRQEYYSGNTFAVEMFNEYGSYFFQNNELYDFYIIKIGDPFYQDMFENIEFLKRLKSYIESTLDRQMLSVEVFVQSLSNKLVGNKLSPLKQGQMIDFIKNLIIQDEFKERLNFKKRRYRYK